MPVFQISSLIGKLQEMGIDCRPGDLLSDIKPARRPYLERWLSNRDGFVRVLGGSIDYIGIEDVMRMGPFYNIYFLIENDFIAEADENAKMLIEASPYFKLRNGKVANLGWTGGVMAKILEQDEELKREFSKNVMEEEVRRITLRAANYACIIETQAWEPAGIAANYSVVDRIALDVRKLLKQIHLGDNIES